MVNLRTLRSRIILFQAGACRVCCGWRSVWSFSQSTLPLIFIPLEFILDGIDAQGLVSINLVSNMLTDGRGEMPMTVHLCWLLDLTSAAQGRR